MNSTTIAPPTKGAIAPVTIPIPPGTCCLRVEPSLADLDFNAGKTITVQIDRVSAGKVVSSSNAVLTTGPLGNGDPPFFQLNCLSLVGNATVASPFGEDSIVVSMSCDDPACVIGAAINQADAHVNLAPTLRAAQSIKAVVS